MIDIHKNKSEKSCIVIGLLLGIAVGALVCDKDTRGIFDE
jgi:hypothetical protein